MEPSPSIAASTTKSTLPECHLHTKLYNPISECISPYQDSWTRQERHPHLIIWHDISQVLPHAIFANLYHLLKGVVPHHFSNLDSMKKWLLHMLPNRRYIYLDFAKYQLEIEGVWITSHFQVPTQGSAPILTLSPFPIFQTSQFPTIGKAKIKTFQTVEPFWKVLLSFLIHFSTCLHSPFFEIILHMLFAAKAL